MVTLERLHETGARFAIKKKNLWPNLHAIQMSASSA
jgi:hypothetical protein